MRNMKFLVVIGVILAMCACQGTGKLTLEDEAAPATITAKFVTADGTEFKGGNLGVYTELFLSFSSDPLASVNVAKVDLNLDGRVKITCSDEMKSFDEYVPLEMVNNTLYKLIFSDAEILQKMDCVLNAGMPEYNVDLDANASYGCAAGGPTNERSLKECLDYSIGFVASVIDPITKEPVNAWMVIPVGYDTFKLLFNMLEVGVNEQGEYVMALGDINPDFATILAGLSAMGGLNKAQGGVFAVVSKGFVAGKEPDVEFTFDYSDSELQYGYNPSTIGVSILNNIDMSLATRQMAIKIEAQKPEEPPIFKSVTGEAGDVICDAEYNALGSSEIKGGKANDGLSSDKCVAANSSHKMRLKFKEYATNLYMIGGWSQDAPWLWGTDNTAMTEIDQFDSSNGTTAGFYYMLGSTAIAQVGFNLDLSKAPVPIEETPSFVAEILWENLGDLPANAE